MTAADALAFRKP